MTEHAVVDLFLTHRSYYLDHGTGWWRCACGVNLTAARAWTREKVEAGWREHLARLLATTQRAGDRLLAPWGPYEMGGFQGCTDVNPDVCACATDTQPTCKVCGEEIEPGVLAWSRQWPCYNTLPLDDPHQDWDVLAWHSCEPRQAVPK